jgi:hypothetical protein
MACCHFMQLVHAMHWLRIRKREAPLLVERAVTTLPENVYSTVTSSKPEPDFGQILPSNDCQFSLQMD